LLRIGKDSKSVKVCNVVLPVARIIKSGGYTGVVRSLIVEVLEDRVGIQIVFSFFGNQIVEETPVDGLVERLATGLDLVEFRRSCVLDGCSSVRWTA
jgi:hypothetical protein